MPAPHPEFGKADTPYNSPDNISEGSIPSLPPVAAGFVFPIIFWVVSFLEEPTDVYTGIGLYTTITSLIAYVFWIVCVYYFHVALKYISKGTYLVSPGKSVFYHFLPFFNLVWIVIWPLNLAKYIRNNSNIRIMPGWLLGALFLFVLLLRYFDGGLGLGLLFGLGMYLKGKLQQLLLETADSTNGEETNTNKKSGSWTTKAGLALVSLTVLVLVFFLVMGVLVESGRLPDSDAKAAGSIHPRHLTQLREMEVINEGEQVQFFYSDAIFSIRRSGSLFTDQRVISYMENEGVLEISSAPYQKISNIEFYSSDSFLEDSIIEITLLDDTWFDLYITTESSGDKRFFSRLNQIWESKR